MVYGDWTLYVKAECWLGTELTSIGIYCDLGAISDDWSCEPQFLFCLRQYGTSSTSANVCPLGSTQAGHFDDDSFCFDDDYIDRANNVPNPITFSNEGSYPVRL